MTPTEKKELFNKLNEYKAEIAGLRSSLNEINDQKESWFDKKEKCRNEISELIKNVRDFKHKRDALTSGVKDSKTKRKEYSDLIRKDIEEVKKLKEEKDAIAKKYGIRDDPSKIKSQIDALEMKIQTEVISFDKERAIMKKIKELKKAYKEAEKVSGVWGKVNDLSRKIDDFKRKAQESHRSVQNKAKESQEKHEGMIETSKKIDELKKEEDNAYMKFMEFKIKFSEANNKLKAKLLEMNEIKKKLDEVRADDEKEKSSRINKTLDEKRAEVEEKLKTKKKLTTADLLVLQSAKE